MSNNTASLTGWGRDDTMTMLEREAERLLERAAAIKAGKQPLVKSLVQELITLCAQLNIERHGMDRAKATQLLAQVDGVRNEMRRLWANLHTPEIHAQVALLQPAYDALNGSLNDQWSECRSESRVKECAELGQALRARRLQLDQRNPILNFATKAV